MPDEEKVIVADDPVAVNPAEEKIEVAPKAPLVSADEKLASQMREDFEKLYGGRFKQLEDGYRAVTRINTKLQQEMEALRNPVSPATPSATSHSPADPWAGIENGQVWRQEIERVAEAKAKDLFQQQEALRLQQEQQAKEDAVREVCKQEVMGKYPDLAPEGDGNSVVSLAFNEILNAHPDYLRNPYGPRLAMYDMESKLKERAQSTTPTSETTRRAKAAASSLPPARTVPGENKLVITREQKQFVDFHKLDPEQYAKIAQALEASGGTGAFET